MSSTVTDDKALDRSIRVAIEHLEPAARRAFTAGVTGPADGLAPELWGEPPTQAERSAAVLSNLHRQYGQRADVMAESLTSSQVADVLGVSEQAVLDRLRSGTLLGLREGREWRVPAWQLSADAERGFLPGLRDLAAAFPGGVVSLSMWAMRSTVELGGRTPAAALVAGDVDAVVATARISTAAAW